MNRSHLVAAAALLAIAGGSHAQVYRCEGEAAYTDRPCRGAAPVDLRANILDAGPVIGAAPAPVEPQPAIILPDMRRPAPPPSGPSTIWERYDSGSSDFRARTGPYQPAMTTP